MERRNKARKNLGISLRLVVDGLEMIGIPPLKGRDHREPGWKEKQEFEDKMRSVIVRHFGKQRRLIRNKLEVLAFQRKALPDIDLDDIYDDDDFLAQLMKMIQEAAAHGIDLFGKNSKVQIDWTLTNKRAMEWARKYAGKLVKDIDDVTRDLLKTVISQFVDTPGMSIGDVMDLLPFDEDRAQRIAVTEITRSYAQATQLAGDDLKEEFPDIRVVKIWFTNNDDIVCELCAPLDGKEVEVDENFYEPESDYEDGNPPRHVNCLPGDTHILPIGGISAVSKRWYEGDCIRIDTLKNQLSITPNHPILTNRGWIAAGQIQKGDYVWSYSLPQFGIMRKTDNQYPISSIENIFNSFGIVDFTVPIASPDFHGDGANSKVCIIRTNSKIVDKWNSEFIKEKTQQYLTPGYIGSNTSFSGLGSMTQFIKISDPTLCSFMSSASLIHPLSISHFRPFESFGLRLISRSNSSLEKTLSEGPAIDPQFLCEFILGLSGNITLQEVIDISNFHFSGHVYNLQTQSNIFSSNGIITHNCRCWTDTTTALGEQ